MHTQLVFHLEKPATKNPDMYYTKTSKREVYDSIVHTDMHMPLVSNSLRPM